MSSHGIAVSVSSESTSLIKPAMCLCIFTATSSRASATTTCASVTNMRSMLSLVINVPCRSFNTHSVSSPMGVLVRPAPTSDVRNVANMVPCIVKSDVSISSKTTASTASPVSLALFLLSSAMVLDGMGCVLNGKMNDVENRLFVDKKNRRRTGKEQMNHIRSPVFIKS